MVRRVLTNGQGGKRLSRDAHESLQAIEVMEFIHNEDSGVPADEAVDVLLGTIHVDGPQGWGAWQKAVYVYRSYMRELRREYGESQFVYVSSLSTTVGRRFNMSTKAVRKALIVYNTYKALEDLDYDVGPTHYHLIDLATGTRTLNEDYFELDKADCCLSEYGLERFGELCIGDSAAVHNPKLLKAFELVYIHGSDSDVARSEDSEEELLKAKARVENKMQRRAFQDQLEKVVESVRDLPINGYRGTARERRLIKQLKGLVVERLGSLL